MAVLEFSGKQKTMLAISSLLLISGGLIMMFVHVSPAQEMNTRRVMMNKLNVTFRGSAAKRSASVHELTPEEQAYQRELLKVELNTAPADELVKIKGVGPSMAKKIIEYREKTPFKSVEDLKNISGVGEKTFQKMAAHVRVGKPGEHVYNAASAAATSEEKKNEKININTATEAELTKLPRVGPSTAKRIIQYREKHGSFKKIEGLMNVSRIGEKTFENIKDRITVRSVRSSRRPAISAPRIVRPGARGTTAASGTKININTADIGQLSELSGIGPKTARRIIDYREKNGNFKKIQDIVKVSRIGQRLFSRIRSKITVK